MDGDGGVKKSEGDRLKCAINKSTLSTAARSPFPNGEGSETRIPLSPTQSLPRVGKVASGASRIGFWRCEKERGNASQVRRLRKHPIHRWRGSPSPMGKATIRGYRFPRHKAFPAWGRWRAKRAGWGSSGVKKSGKDRLKYAVCESTLSTAARSPFPNGEGCDTRMPLFSQCQNKYTHMWKKNNDGQSLPRVGKVASEASRIGY